MLGRRVVNKKLGPRVAGTVVAHVSARFYQTNVARAYPLDPLLWDELYPLWKYGGVAVVRLDEAGPSGGGLLRRPDDAGVRLPRGRPGVGPMIITRTPHRVSLLGGSSDFPAWYRKHGGLVVGGTVDHSVYVTVKPLPPFHAHRHRLAYREVEHVGSLSEIRHRAARACLEELGWPDSEGVEILTASDLPAMSGTGSSSAFVVGLLNALHCARGRYATPRHLAERAVHVEREVLAEAGGHQDQYFAATGGLSLIHFRPGGEVDVVPLSLSPAVRHELQSHLMLFFTRVQRVSADVAATYGDMASREKENFALVRLAEDGLDAVRSRQWEKLGGCIDQSWRIKSGLSASVSTAMVDRAYASARLAGAFGGKLTGSGGGGCLLLVAPPDRQDAVARAVEKEGCVRVPFLFKDAGSRVIFAGEN